MDSSPDIIKVIKPRSMRRVGREEWTGGDKKFIKNKASKTEGKTSQEESGVDGRIILKLILKEQSMGVNRM